MDKPVQELKGYAKTAKLAAGESETVKVVIPIADLASFNEATSAWEVEAGNYKFNVGSSSRDIRVSSEIEIAAQSEKVSDVMKTVAWK